MAIGNLGVGNAKNITADTLIKTGQGTLLGVLVNAASSTPTLTVYDGTDTGGTKLVNALPLTAGQYVPIPAAVGTGIYVDVGGTVDLTIFWL